MITLENYYAFIRYAKWISIVLDFEFRLHHKVTNSSIEGFNRL